MQKCPLVSNTIFHLFLKSCQTGTLNQIKISQSISNLCLFDSSYAIQFSCRCPPNVPITSILTDFTQGSWKDFDVDLSLIGSTEMIWKTSFETTLLSYLPAGKQSEGLGTKLFARLNYCQLVKKTLILISSNKIPTYNTKIPQMVLHWNFSSLLERCFMIFRDFQLCTWLKLTSCWKICKYQRHH